MIEVRAIGHVESPLSDLVGPLEAVHGTPVLDIKPVLDDRPR